MPPPETPQDYYEYFHSQHLLADPPGLAWAAAEHAAQLWLDYHQQPVAPLDTLIAFFRTLTPYRSAGNGFYDLWMCVIDHTHTFPVETQIALWLEIVAPLNQGDRPIGFTEQARAVIERWRELANRLPGQPIEVADVCEVVAMVHPYLGASHSFEWAMLAATLQVWFEQVAPELSFFDLIVERHHQTVAGAAGERAQEPERRVRD